MNDSGSGTNPADDAGASAGLPNESDLPEDSGFEGSLESDEKTGLETPLRTPLNEDPGFPADDHGAVAQ